ncbi:MAG: class I tRNA ligase family protein [Candidatus Nanopelagicales bacterium]
MKSWPEVSRPSIPISIDAVTLEDAMSGTQKVLRLPDTTSYIYVCGITPYDSTHIGHAATYVFFDVLHRVLLATNKPVRMIENVTDIDEPLFKKADEIKEAWNVLAEKQVTKFAQDMTVLRVIPPFEFVSVSENLTSLVSHIGKLIENGTAYFIDGDVYFAYQGGEATELDLQIFKERGGDPDRAGKKHPLDAVLWRLTADQPNFDSPWGLGRPGWHIECVSIIEDCVSQPLLIQGGGSDLRFPHHVMSDQQYRALTGQLHLAEVFFHIGMVKYQGEKMSKSLGNLVFVSDLIESGVSSMVIRYAILMQNFAKEWEWSDEVLREAEKRYHRVVDALSCESTADANHLIETIKGSLSNNLNTRMALDALDDWATETLQVQGNHSHAGVVSRTIDALLGIGV